MEILLQKSPQGFLIPSSETDIDKVRKFKVGAVIRCTVTQMRNYQLHKKWFALLKIAYDVWVDGVERRKYKDIDVEPDFDRFRKDVTILAGFFKATYNVRGDVRLEAESISFANMDQDKFEELYSKTIGVVLEKILPAGRFTEEQLRRLVEDVMRFDQ